jgi:hypothetical protein
LKSEFFIFHFLFIEESHPTSFTVIQMTLLTKLLSWPPAFLLPGLLSIIVNIILISFSVFDILTHLVLRSSSSLSLSQWRGGAIFSTLFNISNSSPEIQSLSLLTLRLFPFTSSLFLFNFSTFQNLDLLLIQLLLLISLPSSSQISLRLILSFPFFLIVLFAFVVVTVLL